MDAMRYPTSTSIAGDVPFYGMAHDGRPPDSGAELEDLPPPFTRGPYSDRVVEKIPELSDDKRRQPYNSAVEEGPYVAEKVKQEDSMLPSSVTYSHSDCDFGVGEAI